jgi:hypothetical protein
LWYGVTTVPGRFLTDAQRARLSRFPDDVLDEDLAAHFTLTDADRALIDRRRRDDNRLGFALQLCTLRFLGFVPDDVRGMPLRIVAYVAEQLGASPSELATYAAREQTRTDHQVEAQAALGFRSADLADVAHLGEWLQERALEHDKPTLLLQMAAERLRAARIVRPGVTSMERLVVTARERAERETLRRLGALLSAPVRTALQLLAEASKEALDAVLLHLGDRHRIDARRALVAPDPLPRLRQDVTPADVVVQRVEASPRMPLGCGTQSPLQLSHFVVRPTAAGVVRSAPGGHSLALTCFADLTTAGTLRSGRVVRRGHHRYYGPLGLPLRGARLRLRLIRATLP